MAARGKLGQEGGWGKKKDYGRSRAHAQRTDDLFDHYIRLLAGLRPRAFVAENVFGLARGLAKGKLVQFLAKMQSHGYRVRVRELDARWLGVPQHRRRLIFVGVRDDVRAAPAHPSPLPWEYSVAEALDHPSCPGEVDEAAKIEGYAIEAEARKLAPGQKSEKFFNLRRLAAGEPARTILASGGHPGAASVLVPSGLRKPTIAELKRLCGFPEDFRLTGNYEQRWERLGRAVPPPMMRAVGEVIRDFLLAASREVA